VEVNVHASRRNISSLGTRNDCDVAADKCFLPSYFLSLSLPLFPSFLSLSLSSAQNIAAKDFENWGRKEREMDSSFSLKIMLAGLVSFSNGSIDMIS
jgi:hypothetical protein